MNRQGRLASVLLGQTKSLSGNDKHPGWSKGRECLVLHGAVDHLTARSKIRKMETVQQSIARERGAPGLSLL
jgi:hypothetical protein